jgi:hypothetical protein
MDFRPEINVLSIGQKYRPMYRLQPTERWCLIRRDRKPVECDTASQARKVAQELVDAIVSPVHVIEEEPEPLGNVEDWRKGKKAEAIEERERVFGAAAPSRLFVKGREIEVKRLGRRVRA